MYEQSHHRRAVELLQQLGCKEYEARAFVALSRLTAGTAKDVSETSDVPRTRVYDAIRVLEERGLVETKHSNPKQFRAVSVAEAVETLRSTYEDRAESLGTALRSLDPIEGRSGVDGTHEVWALSGAPAIRNRSLQLFAEAEEEIIFVIGDDSGFDENVVEHLRAADERGISVVVGGPDETSTEAIDESLPDVETFVSGLEGLHTSPYPNDETKISRLLLIDGETILVSSFTPAATDENTNGLCSVGGSKTGS